MRMANAPNPPNPRRELAKLRWRSTVVDRAVDTLAQRSDELTDSQRPRLRELAGAPKKQPTGTG
jgi:hypothetical protein